MKIKSSKSIIHILLITAGLLMAIQIAFGFLWMSKNIMVIPSFGDSGEYLELSKTLALDEYRPVLYPLILRWIQKLSKTNYQTWLYLIQTVISFLCLFYGVHTIDKAVLKKEYSRKRLGLQVFFSLYLLTIPMITFMNFCVLTDSLATSMLMVFLSGCVRMFTPDRTPIWVYLSMASSLLAECLLRADRLYSCLLLAVIVFLVCLFKKRRYRKQILIAMLSVCLSVTVIVKAVNHFTQTPGLNGRVQTNFEFVLLDRIVWPNMEANYPFFSKEIQNTITLEDAKTFDKHNNNVMYQMAPLVEAKVGKEKAREMYREMAGIVFSHQTKKVLLDIGEDILAMAATPFSSTLNAHKLCKKGDSWNVHCMSTETPELTSNYNRFYQYAFLILIIFGLIISVWRRTRNQQGKLRRLPKVLLPYIGMSLILTLWFCIGDGAPPNDRYAMIIYITWAFLPIGLFGI